MAEAPRRNFGSILGSASRDFGGALRLFAYALLGALALCDSAWCVEEHPRRIATRAPSTMPSSSTGRWTRRWSSRSPVSPMRCRSRSAADAIEPLTRAVNILRRSGGLYDPRQYALLNQLDGSASLQGDVDAAVAALAYMERVSERTHGRQSTQHALSLAGIAALALQARQIRQRSRALSPQHRAAAHGGRGSSDRRAARARTLQLR